MQVFESYLKELGSRLVPGLRLDTNAARLKLALDGEPGRILRRSVPIEYLRQRGIFLTGSALSYNLLQHTLVLTGGRTKCYIDPACGAGDLLIACASQLPVEQLLSATLCNWNDRLSGFDIVPQLVKATQLRLALFAVSRGATVDISTDHVRPLLSNIRVYSAFQDWSVPPGSVIVLNPPFTLTAASDSCEWASGRITRAAAFIDRCLKVTPNGAIIAAILPDVLRTGPRYRAWREYVSKHTDFLQSKIVGLFDPSTDVDVFSVILRKADCGTATSGWHRRPTSKHKLVSDLFEVRVGTIVPHRHANSGTWKSYVHPRVLPPWKIVDDAGLRIRAASAFEGPFVAIRRTSGLVINSDALGR